MAIVKNLTITVNGANASLSKPVYLWLGDGQTTLLINILEVDGIFGTFKNSGSNLVTESGSKWAEVCLLKADGELVYSDRCEVLDDMIKFVISKDFIDEIGEKGTHVMQIALFDDDDEETANKLTIPPVSLSVMSPIWIDHNPS